jgi:low temperature requirement protein LtrA
MAKLVGWTGPRFHAPGGQSVTFVELFFDLVFVFALTEVTGFAAEHLDAGGVARTILIFWLIWWAWSQWTWALNPADTEHGLVRLATLAATAIAFGMAVSVEDAFDVDDGLWFVVPYILLRVLGLALYARVAADREGHFAAVRTFAALSTLGFAAVLIGGFADPDARVWWWLAGVVLDLLVAAKVAGFEGWHIHPEHFTERHGLFVIIALGESLIVAAAGVAHAERTTELAAVAIGAVAVTCLLWWTYFGWLEEGLGARLRELKGGAQSSLARDAYSLLHLLIIGGVVGVAVGLEEMVAHPGEEVPANVLAALGVGIGLFVGASALAWARARREVLWARLVVPAGLGALLVPASELAPGWILALVVGSLVTIVATEAILRPGPN